MKKKDPSNFRQFITDAPNQFNVGFQIAQNIKLNLDFSSLTISGMGGSALPANLLQTYLDDLFMTDKKLTKINIHINRTYLLPEVAYKSSLNIISSYSGNTEETLSVFNEAYRNRLPLIGISSGGKVEELCKEFNVPHIKLPVPYPNYQPRMGTGYFFAAILQIMTNHNLIPNKSKSIIENAKELISLNINLEQQGEKLSKLIFGKTPVIYANSQYRSVAMVWKIKINENAKTPAFWNFFPEANHNEMVGYTKPQGKFIIIMLKDNDDDKRNLRRYETTAKLMNEYGTEHEIVEINGKNVFAKMFSSIYLADWTSYYLALAYKQDPTPVEMVEKLKKVLA